MRPGHPQRRETRAPARLANRTAPKSVAHVVVVVLMLIAGGLGIATTVDGVYDGRTVLALALVAAALTIYRRNR